VDTPTGIANLRAGAVARAIARHRLIVVLRRVGPRDRLLSVVDGLADAGLRLFEITFDDEAAPDDLRAVAAMLAGRPDPGLAGAGTIRAPSELEAAIDAGAAFGVSPVLDLEILDRALGAGLPFVPGAFSPTEADLAWRRGATFVKLFPGSSVGPSHVRELLAPLPEIGAIVTGGVDAASARSFLDAGAVAVGVGSALVTADTAGRRAIVEAVRVAGPFRAERTEGGR
jgi:2-dehydro-3-deoxyphosphogluconate aldolase/(4S)-4-hydroxy-2-oxoglutarate aldolase